jgi:hypothetical protein
MIYECYVIEERGQKLNPRRAFIELANQDPVPEEGMLDLGMLRGHIDDGQL